MEKEMMKGKAKLNSNHNFAGPFVVKESEAPNHPTATAGMVAGCSIKLGCHLILLGEHYHLSEYVTEQRPMIPLQGYMFFANRRRNRKYCPADRARSEEAGMQDQTEFNENWSARVDANYVTDDYYLRDLGNTPQAITTDQLLNQALLRYQSEHWQFQGEVQAYQTLHLIDQTFVSDQYQRLPQLDLSTSYPGLPGGFDFEANTELTNFQHVQNFFTNQAYPTVGRFHLNVT